MSIEETIKYKGPHCKIKELFKIKDTWSPQCLSTLSVGTPCNDNDTYLQLPVQPIETPHAWNKEFIITSLWIGKCTSFQRQRLSSLYLGHLTRKTRGFIFGIERTMQQCLLTLQVGCKKIFDVNRSII